MFDIVIDTNIYRKDPGRAGLPFKALERLCNAKSARLHIPYIVLREFQTQQVDIYQKEMHAALKGISAVLKKNLSEDVKANIINIKAAVETAMPDVAKDAANGIIKWANEIGAVLHPFTAGDAEQAMEAYFNGHPPLKEPKVRKDIPDAFLFQAALRILDNVQTLYVISEDGAFCDAAASVKNVVLLKSLNDFVELPEVQEALKKHDEAKKIAVVVERLQASEDRQLEIVIERSLGDKVAWQKIHSKSIPDDNHEALISGFGDCKDIEIDFAEAAYYGEGQLGLPFSCTMTVSAIYYIFKSDYFALDNDKLPQISDHNDHYFEAESTFDVVINGSISVDIDLDAFSDDQDVFEYVDIDSAKIDEEISIELDEF